MPSKMQNFPFAFGVSQFTTRPCTFEQDVDRYARLGVEMIEVCEEKLDEKRFAEQMEMIAAGNLKVSAIQPLVRTFGSSQMQPQPKSLHARTARLRTSIERLAPFAPGCPFILNTGAPEGGNIQGLIDIVIKEVSELAAFATRYDVKLALEPLNPTAMNTETAIWTVSQAMDIIDKIDSDNVGLCLDLWNCWQDAEIIEEITRAGCRIFALQVSDWRMPRSGADRLIPGDGSIPLGRLLHKVHEAGYFGACTVEIFSQHVPIPLWAADPNMVIMRSRAGLEAAWANF